VQTEKSITSFDSCFMLPVQRGKAGSLRDFWDDAGEKYGTDTDGHFKLFGVQKLLAFMQTMPDDREYLVMYMRTSDTLDKTLKGLFGKDLKCSKHLTSRFKDFTGVDLSKSENLPRLERLFDWKETREFLEERQMNKMPWCSTAPILPGKTQATMKYMKDAMSRRSEWEKLLRDHDVVRNLAFIQHTSQGDYVVKYTVASSPLADLVTAFTSCSHEMCNTARSMAKELTGLDMTNQKNMPDLKLLFKWDDTVGFQTAEQSIAYTE